MQVFDSRSPNCKTPYGAVPCRTEILLTLRPLTAEGFLSCQLILQYEFADKAREVPLSPDGTEGVYTVFSGSYTVPEEPELIWYYFRFMGEDGAAVDFGRNGFCRKDGEVPEPWQQTVYEDTLATPDWFGRGVTYQIFPDRFRRSSVPDPTGMLGHRTIHRAWDEPMELPEEQGIYVNSDFYGGTLAGIEEKLEYLHSLHVTTLYLCPVFESDSNHRYNTGDYERIDPMLGTEEDFRRLCGKAHALGIRVMLDGVFNHTGSNSRYFNADASYPDPGAAQSKDSPYYSWYTFQKWPTEYDSWWGVHTMPAVNESHPGYIDYIIEGENSIIRRWLRAGADAWRLDVADELPDEFIARIRAVMSEEKPGSFLLGEVWEDGSNKIAYDRRRRYLLGRETHGLMNYPFRVSALAYLQGGDASEFQESMERIRENYPPAAFYSAMNM
ncbi:MAG: glycoside hydrolase family 13 protein, partial [Oscillospiraceae bacterium]|nr:glycoside hydrolase family 13 protein [Oscillospiraceae bacterium]